MTKKKCNPDLIIWVRSKYPQCCCLKCFNIMMMMMMPYFASRTKGPFCIRSACPRVERGSDRVQHFANANVNPSPIKKTREQAGVICHCDFLVQAIWETHSIIEHRSMGNATSNIEVGVRRWWWAARLGICESGSIDRHNRIYPSTKWGFRRWKKCYDWWGESHGVRSDLD